MKTDHMIFVFGSNKAGIHGGGAAKHALHYRGANLRQGWGLQGQSFGIPTKDENIKSLHIIDVQLYIDSFIDYANEHQDMEFQVTRIGCGLAGFKDEEIAPMFDLAPANCFFDEKWKPFLCSSIIKHYWGTF
ncbi:hypothetical protein PP742_gp60 [Alcaligenes phage vB_Af_QDWS595]|uniref:Uncharacterized protein n=1 Tax=Alcaligenes phage vB_Af_QDWS595 TaxID=2877946 RepID=A0AAE8Y288_9CAUD|nr:hypothetical protein PP742_gp60 [Alcaligenes phage vB_Af_QDWS595]UCR75544.1 hypothetical protein vBAfaPQDWS595_60 [Alcaligenes phage vB_Af_QDWS595]